MGALLSVASLTKGFGGINALTEVTFSIPGAGIHAIIGPNGAGKTTLLNLITGVYSPDSGEIMVAGHRVTGLSPDVLTSYGMSRTFQNLQVCMNMTALENVMVGAHNRLDQRLLPALMRTSTHRRAERECRDFAVSLMESVGVGAYVDAQAEALSYGMLKRLEIARSLAARPRLLLLDEPAAGLNTTEKQELGSLLKRLSESGIVIVLVEHDMGLVMRLSDKVIVLNHGRKMFEGPPEEATSNPEVISAYLGTAL